MTHGRTGMIERHIEPDTESGFLVIRPNQSMSWTANCRWMTVLSMFTIGLAILFALRGFWPILVAAFLQIGWLWLAIYKVALDCQQRECVRFTASEIVVHRGRYRPTQELRFPRPWTRLIVRRDSSGGQSSRLFLRCCGRETELGRCLRDEERQRLAADLRPLLLSPTRHA